MQVSVAVLGATLAFAVLAAAFSDLLDDLRRERETDPLTGVLNRRGFEDRSEILLRKVSGRPVSMALCDLDHLKSINDTLGYHSGDEVLRRFGELLRSELRMTDLARRIGGEEFAVFMPDTGEAEAMLVLEQLRSRAEDRLHEALKGHSRVTASFGVAQRRTDESLQDLMRRADALLYGAKSAGRNRIARSNANAPSAGFSLEVASEAGLSAHPAKS